MDENYYNWKPVNCSIKVEPSSDDEDTAAEYVVNAMNGSSQQGSNISDDGGVVVVKTEDQCNSFAYSRSDGDSDDELFHKIAIPQVLLECSRSPSPRDPSARKQTLCFRDTDLTELLSFEDSEKYETEKIRQNRPLYQLNPDDFKDDRAKQMQIRRAIITYRHHQAKKDQINKLTDENVLLRQHVESLKRKITELSCCGCKTNKRINLDILGVPLPGPTLPLKLQQINKTATSSKTCLLEEKSMTPSKCVDRDTVHCRESTDLGSQCRTGSIKYDTATTSPEVKEPLINIVSSHYANLRPQTFTTAEHCNVKLNSNWNRNAVVAGPTQFTGISTRNSTGSRAKQVLLGPGGKKCGDGFVPHGKLAAASDMKKDSDVHAQQSKMPQQKVTASPAEVPLPASRIVFAKRRKSTTDSVQKLSRLLMELESTTIPLNVTTVTTDKQTSQSTQSPLTASQLVFGSRREGYQGLWNSPHKSYSAGSSPSPALFYRSVGGQLLQLIAEEPCGSFSSADADRNINDMQTEIAMEKQKMEEMYSLFDGDDLALILAVNAHAASNQ